MPESFGAKSPSPPPSSSSHNHPPSSPQCLSMGGVAAVSQELPGITPLPESWHTNMKTKQFHDETVIRSHIWPHLDAARTHQDTHVCEITQGYTMCHILLHLYASAFLRVVTITAVSHTAVSRMVQTRRGQQREVCNKKQRHSKVTPNLFQ